MFARVLTKRLKYSPNIINSVSLSKQPPERHQSTTTQPKKKFLQNSQCIEL